ncbi:MAG: M23 family metallopeptidase [Bacteroidales bacterium]|nr:M23 family metallopeptidase [Bacteroidales bacterium]
MGNSNPGEWNKIYRLSLEEDHTHKRVRFWRFSRIALIVWGVTALVAVSLLAWCIIALTPLKTTVPGYPDAHFKRGAIANALKIDSLENEMTRWALYAENLGRVLAGEQTISPDSLLANNTAEYLRKLSDAEIARGDSLLRDAVTGSGHFGVSERKRELPLEGMHFFTPLKGTVTQSFDAVLHPAIDITAPAGAAVCAVLDGTVIFAGWTDEAGYTIALQHRSGLVSYYKHNQKILRKTGDKVSAGASIALVGSTGSLTTSDHLRFELWHDGEAIDPAKYCKF